jgi:hypothetical protein
MVAFSCFEVRPRNPTGRLIFLSLPARASNRRAGRNSDTANGRNRNSYSSASQACDTKPVNGAAITGLSISRFFYAKGPPGAPGEKRARPQAAPALRSDS